MQTKDVTTPQGQSEKAVEGIKQEEKQAQNVAPTELSTSQKLFARMAGKDIPSVRELFKPTEAAEKAKEKIPDPEKGEPKPEAKKEEKKYLNLEEYKDALLKLKVDGVEREDTLANLVRLVQTDEHVTKKSQRVSEEERRLRDREQAIAERERLVTEMLAQSKPKEADNSEESFVKDDPIVRRMEKEMSSMREQLKAIQEQAQPVLFKAAIARVSSHVKETMGFDDFESYQGKIKETLLALPPEQARSLDNEAGWLSTYKEIKLKELLQAQRMPKAEEVKPSIERPAPKIVPVESGRANSSAQNDDFATRRRELLARAKQLTLENHRDKDKAWIEYLDYTKTEDGKE
jgi:hypothetical protein